MTEQKNIEIKARCRDIEKARGVAESLQAELFAEGDQTDLYFHSPQGRLKLRTATFDENSQLIWYSRPDVPDARVSEVRIARIRKPDKLRELCVAHFGAIGEVKKHRTIFLDDSVRIHLDTVDGLGTFIEFEAPADGDEQLARKRVNELIQQFEITQDDLVSTSYSEMLFGEEAKQKQQ